MIDLSNSLILSGRHINRKWDDSSSELTVSLVMLALVYYNVLNTSIYYRIEI
jgi:hypothetical protein